MIDSTISDQSIDASAPQPERRRLAGLRGLRPARMHVHVHTLDSLHYRNFLLLWLSTTFTGAGFWVEQLVVGWLTYDLTGSPFITSLAIGLRMLPFIVAGPVGGVVADRWDKRRFLVIVSVYQATVAAAFATVVILDHVETWHIFVFALVMGLSSGLADPTRTTLVANLVPRGNLVNAFALNGLAFNVTRLVVPVSAGFLMVLVGPGATLLIGVSMYLAATAAVASMRPDEGHEGKASRPAANVRLLDGLRFVAREPLVLGIILLLAVPPLLLMPSVQGLMPVYATEVFAVGGWGLGMLLSAIGAGGTIAALVVASLADIRYKGRAMLGALALAALAAALFSRSPSLPLAVPLLVVMTGGVTSFFAIGFATLQGLVPDELRGRVSSIALMLIGLWPVGAAISGGLAGTLGAPAATLMAACTVAAALLAISWRYPQVWALRQG